MIFRTILNLSGSSPTTGLTLSATGLYFFLVTAKVSEVLYEGFLETVLQGWDLLVVESQKKPSTSQLDLLMVVLGSLWDP